MTARIEDKNGFVTVQGNPITRAGVTVYKGRDLPSYPGNGNDDVRVLKHPDDLSRPETLESFKLIPFIQEHIWLGEEGIDPAHLPLTGTTGENVYWDPPFIRASIRWFTPRITEELQSGKNELSVGYHFTLIPESGVYEGEPYDYRATNIRGNHVINCVEGRAGPTVAVMDAVLTKKSEEIMTYEEILAAVQALAPEDRERLLADLTPAVTEDAVVDPIVEDEVAPESTSMSSAMEKAEDLIDEAKAVLESAPEAGGMASDEETKMPFLAETKAQDALNSNIKAILAAMAARNIMAERLSRHIGVFAFDSMTLSDVAEYGCEKLGMKAKGRRAIDILNGYLSAVEKNHKTLVAFDSVPAHLQKTSGSKITEILRGL